jgi:hypothetical protein
VFFAERNNGNRFSRTIPFSIHGAFETQLIGVVFDRLIVLLGAITVIGKVVVDVYFIFFVLEF